MFTRKESQMAGMVPVMDRDDAAFNVLPTVLTLPMES